MQNTHRIGYACLNLDVIPNSFRTCRIHNLKETLHREIISHNLEVLNAMIDYNIEHSVKLYRISSSLIPFASSERCTLLWQEVFQEKFADIAQKIRQHNIRISMHPGQYTLINSPDKRVVYNAVKELEYHADVLDLLSAEYDAKIILHIGGIYKDKEKSALRFIENYRKLPEKVQARLVIENDDKFFNLKDVLSISDYTGIPVVYDNLHHKINSSFPEKSEYDILKEVLKTWKGKGKAKMHYSQQAPAQKAGAHSRTINLNEFVGDFEAAYKYFDIDIMLEVKDKNRSFKKIDTYLNPGVKKLDEEWARYKYLVMSKSYADYLHIQSMFRDKKNFSVADFYEAVDTSIKKEDSIKSQVNTMEHIWGYFKKISTPKEKEMFFNILDKYKNEQSQGRTVWKFLLNLSQKYDNTYLLSSYAYREYCKVRA